MTVPPPPPELPPSPALIVTLHSGRTVYLPPAPPRPRPSKLTSQCSTLRSVFQQSGMFAQYKVSERIDHVHRHNVQCYTKPEGRVQVPCYEEDEGKYSEMYIADLMYSSDVPQSDTDDELQEDIVNPIFLPLNTIPSPLLYHAVPYGPDYTPGTGRVIFKESRMGPPSAPISDSRGVSRNSMTDTAAVSLHREVLVDRATVPEHASMTPAPAPDLDVVGTVQGGAVSTMLSTSVANVDQEEMVSEVLEGLVEEECGEMLSLEYNESDDFEEAMSELQQDCQEMSLEEGVRNQRTTSVEKNMTDCQDLGQNQTECMGSDYNKENELQIINTGVAVGSLKGLVKRDQRLYPSRERKSRTFFI